VSLGGETVSTSLAGSGRAPMTFAQRSESTPVPIYLAHARPGESALECRDRRRFDTTAVLAGPPSSVRRTNGGEDQESGPSVVLAPISPIAVAADRLTVYELGMGGEALSKLDGRLLCQRGAPKWVSASWATRSDSAAARMRSHHYIDSVEGGTPAQ
jgi:hypothetical protein